MLELLFSGLKKKINIQNSSFEFNHSFACWYCYYECGWNYHSLRILSLFTTVLDFEHPERALLVIRKCQDSVDMMGSRWMWRSKWKGVSSQAKWTSILKHKILKEMKKNSRCLPKGTNSEKEEIRIEGFRGEILMKTITSDQNSVRLRSTNLYWAPLTSKTMGERALSHSLENT